MPVYSKVLKSMEQRGNDDIDISQTRGQVKGPTKHRTIINWNRLPEGIIGFAIFGFWWAVGGRYTIDGAPLLLNGIFDFFYLPYELPIIKHWSWYAALSWLPVFISKVEQAELPGTPILIAIWALVVIFDAGTTYLAVTNPGINDPRIIQQIATIDALAIGWSLATTFLPELCMMWLLRYMRG